MRESSNYDIDKLGLIDSVVEPEPGLFEGARAGKKNIEQEPVNLLRGNRRQSRSR